MMKNRDLIMPIRNLQREKEGRRAGKEEGIQKEGKKGREGGKWREGKESKLVMDRYSLFFLM